MSAEGVRVAVTFSAQLLDDVVESKGQQRTASNQWKPTSDFVAEHDAAPSNEEAENRCEKNVPAPCQCGDKEGFCPTPFLHAGCKDERQPVRGNGGVEKSHCEASNNDRGKYCVG